LFAQKILCVYDNRDSPVAISWDPTINFHQSKERKMVMKRVPVFLAVLLLATTAVWAQNKNEKPAKPKPAAVDCSKVDDAKLTADVKGKLGDAPSLKDLTINVTVSAGAVTLTGKAMKPTQKGTATRVAKAVKCVKKVDNQMTVEGAAPKTKSKNANKM